MSRLFLSVIAVCLPAICAIAQAACTMDTRTGLAFNSTDSSTCLYAKDEASRWVGIWNLPALVGPRELEGPAPVLTVRYYNHAKIPAAELHAAEREASNIFALAGVTLKWVDCGTSADQTDKIAACDRVADRKGTALKLLPKSMASGLPRPSRQFAVSIPSMVFVFCHRVRDGAAKAGVPERQVLGDILAHELGHVVLGPFSHSKSGIMKAMLQPNDFAMAQKGGLRFTKAQAKQLIAEIQ